jgi:NADH-quinone oxidoreductase subunit F
MRIESKDQFEALRVQALEIDANRKQQVLVCCGTGCLASGSKEVAEAFASEIAKRSIDASVELFVKPTGCHGFCERGPLVVLNPQGILYTKVKAGRVEEIVEKTLVAGEVIPGLLYKEPVSGERVEKYEEVPFYKHQLRVAMRNIRRQGAVRDDARRSHRRGRDLGPARPRRSWIQHRPQVAVMQGLAGREVLRAVQRR